MLFSRQRESRRPEVPSSVRVHLLAASEISVVEPVWRSLEERLGGRPAVSWTWTRSWLQHYASTVSARFAVVERHGVPIGAVLLTTSRRRAFGTRRLHLGTGGEPPGEGVYVEYNDVLCAPADRPIVLAALVDELCRQPDWDELVAPGMRPDAAAVLRTTLPVDETVEKSWTMRLVPEVATSAALKGPVRRLVRQARESLEPRPPELVRGVDRAREVMAELARLHQRRWNAVGRAGAFASPRLSGFLAALVDAWIDEGRVMVLRLPDERDSTLGCVVGFVEDDRFLYYQGGFQRHPGNNRKRAGLLCHVEFAELCRREGMREYELLCGDDRYKRQLGNGEHNVLHWSRYRRPTARNAGIDLARRAVATARRATD